MKLLCIEDEEGARALIEKGLGRRGFRVECVGTAAEGVSRALGGDYDALVVDVVLPDAEGFAVLERIREQGVETPALFLSERSQVQDRLEGFRVGGDDYLPKPFSLAELEARLRSICRRGPAAPEPADRLVLADLVMDVPGQRVTRAGKTLDLAPKQLAILELLLRNANRVVSHAALIERAWGWDADVRANTLAVQINYLRNKLDRDFEPKLIHTKPGVGYVLEDRSGAASGEAEA